VPNPNRLPPWGAALCSLIVAGLGQTLLGQVAKGVVILLIGVVRGALIVGVGAIIIWIIASFDAYQIAKKLNSGVLVRTWGWF
jgi:TM2 domain-containing membrane protein YozV